MTAESRIEAGASAPPRSLRSPSFVPIAADAWRFAGPLAAVVAACAALGWDVAVWLLGLVLVTVVFFFRDPERPIPPGEHVVVSPADGHLTFAGEAGHPEFPGGRCLKIGIFLSVLDVHINRMPVAGRVVRSERRPGRFLNAMRPEAAIENARHDIWLETAWGPILVRQIAGLIARRIVCNVGPGDAVARGERFGLIRFGSGTEVYLPLPAMTALKKGDFVRGGKSAIATMG